MNSTPPFVVQIIKEYWSPGKKILEIGCGPAFLRDFFLKDYIGVDITNEPYNEDLLRNVDIVCGAENLLIESASIDIVVIKSSFYLFEDHAKALQEAKRVLKDKGTILIFDYNKRTQNRLQKNETKKIYPCWTQWKLKKILQKNGFKEVKNFLASYEQPLGLILYYKILKQELNGDWAIVSGRK